MNEAIPAGSRSRQMRSVSAAMIAAGVFAIAAVALLWFLFDVLLLIFGAVLLAVLFRAPGELDFRAHPLVPRMGPGFGASADSRNYRDCWVASRQRYERAGAGCRGTGPKDVSADSGPLG